MNPRWMRNHVACPECGHIYRESADLERAAKYRYNPVRGEVDFISVDCPNCKAHFTGDDFWNEQHEKWDRTMKEETV